MKRALFIFGFVLICIAASAQNVVVVNSQTVFKSIAAYNAAETQLENLAKARQGEVDNAFKQVEAMYNSYMEQKQYLTEMARQQREQAIVTREEEATKRQEAIFGPEGELMKKRVELVKPIQDRVFGIIKEYANRTGAAVVIDIASNPNVLYYSPVADKTQDIINLVK